MPVKIVDPTKAASEARRKAISEDPEAEGIGGAAEIAGLAPRKTPGIHKRTVLHEQPSKGPIDPEVDPLKQDFRLFLILGWKRLLNVSPTPAMLDMAYNMQHGPDQMVIEAFRGFSKSWIAGLFALWLLYCNPQEKVMIQSGALDRAVASTNWCLTLILTWPLLAHLKPTPNQRQSSKAFDVGPATPEQSPSFHALGIGGQSVGFRASFILGDDVETDKNSITVTMRDKIEHSVKEYEAVLLPGGRILFLGTPHNEDSLYNKMPAKGYTVLIYPALYPTPEQAKDYGAKLAPFILQQIRKLGPGCIGKSIMPSRFSDDDLARRKKAIGNSTFALQFMLDTTLSDRNRYPLKVGDLMVMSLDPRRGPELISWSGDTDRSLKELPLMGFSGDGYHSPVLPPDVRYAPYNRIVGYVDNSGRGADETALSIAAELNGIVFWLKLWASKGGFTPETLATIAKLCVELRVQKLRIESNFGDGMFTALLSPVLVKAWERFNKLHRGEPGGTEIVEVHSSNIVAKEKRILSVLEPVTQQHRLVVDKGVIEWDFESISALDGEDTRHRYAAMHQFTHLTRERDSLEHDDRVESLAGVLADFADILGVDPQGMAAERSVERDDEEYEKLFGELEEDDRGILGQAKSHETDKRPEAVKVHKR